MLLAEAKPPRGLALDGRDAITAVNRVKPGL